MKPAALERLKRLAARCADGADDELASELSDILQTLEDELDFTVLEKRRLVDQLARSASLAELGLMAAAIFHEMNQPLLGIKGFAELIIEGLRGGDPAKISEWAGEIRDQAARMHGMQRDVASFLGRDDQAGKSAKLKSCLEQALRLFRQRLAKKNIQLLTGIPDDLPDLDIGPNQLVQILVNLIGNAVDAINGPGRLSIAASSSPERRVKVLIADSGTGIPENLRRSVFEPFTSSKGEKGTGLGLYIAHTLAENNGGRLTLTDPAELGWQETPATVFELLLDQAGEKKDAQAPAAMPDGNDPLALVTRRLDEFARGLSITRRVLVVDDEPVILRVLSEFLAQHEILADIVPTAEDALLKLSERDYAVVISDKNLPGMDGIELLGKIKTKWNEVEVLIITGYASIDSAIEAIAAGAFDYIPKPFPNLAYVAEKVRGALARHDFERRVRSMISFLSDTCKSQLMELAAGDKREIIERLEAALKSGSQEEKGRLIIIGPASLTNNTRRQGYDVTPASSLDQAVSLLASGEYHVVIFVDEEGGPDAAHVVETLRAAHPDVGVFVVSTESNLKKIVSAIGVGVGDYLIRPFEGRELFSPRLKRLVSRQQHVWRYRRVIESLKKLNIDLQVSTEANL
ncbi:MAG TPA: response regulator [Myxococcota bacterium]|nr:response regulator [Myxococcota bacterium]